MKTSLLKIYHLFVKEDDYRTRSAARNLWRRLALIKQLLGKDVFVPFEPIGHFYSSYPSLKDISEHDFSQMPEEIEGVDLDAAGQLRLLDSFDGYYKELPFQDERTDGLRYWFKNDAYGYSDAVFLYFMIRYLSPKNIIEAGSGYSSCVILDTNEIFFDNGINCTFIEPYPALLYSLGKNDDRDRISVKESRLQDVPLDIFKTLNRNDILFIDSTHVSKLGSDVNYIIHKILPILNDGVFIHFHDIFYPFEYPREWFTEGVNWNEQYILRAFLEYNANFRIRIFNTYLQTMHREKLADRFPLIFKENKGGSMKNAGGSIWIEKLPPPR